MNELEIERIKEGILREFRKDQKVYEEKFEKLLSGLISNVFMYFDSGWGKDRKKSNWRWNALRKISKTSNLSKEIEEIIKKTEKDIKRLDE